MQAVFKQIAPHTVKLSMYTAYTHNYRMYNNHYNVQFQLTYTIILLCTIIMQGETIVNLGFYNSDILVSVFARAQHRCKIGGH